MLFGQRHHPARVAIECERKSCDGQRVMTLRTRMTAAAMIIALAACGGCYYAYVAPRDASPATEARSARVHSTFWGLSNPQVTPANCEGNGMAEVTAHTNLAYALASLFTLGFWNVSDVSWRCSKDRMP